MAALLAVARLLATPAGAQAPGPPGAAWHPAPAHLALFTPARHRDAYAAYVSSEPPDRALDSALAGLPAGTQAFREGGSWAFHQVAAADAFGGGGAYDRWQLVRLYGARGPRVARGTITGNDRPVEMWTLISPYPDATLRRLEPGTLLLVLRIP